MCYWRANPYHLSRWNQASVFGSREAAAQNGMAKHTVMREKSGGVRQKGQQ